MGLEGAGNKLCLAKQACAQTQQKQAGAAVSPLGRLCLSFP